MGTNNSVLPSADEETAFQNQLDAEMTKFSAGLAARNRVNNPPDYSADLAKERAYSTAGMTNEETGNVNYARSVGLPSPYQPGTQTAPGSPRPAAPQINPQFMAVPEDRFQRTLLGLPQKPMQQMTPQGTSSMAAFQASPESPAPAYQPAQPVTSFAPPANYNPTSVDGSGYAPPAPPAQGTTVTPQAATSSDRVQKLIQGAQAGNVPLKMLTDLTGSDKADLISRGVAGDTDAQAAMLLLPSQAALARSLIAMSQQKKNLQERTASAQAFQMTLAQQKLAAEKEKAGAKATADQGKANEKVLTANEKNLKEREAEFKKAEDGLTKLNAQLAAAQSTWNALKDSPATTTQDKAAKAQAEAAIKYLTPMIEHAKANHATAMAARDAAKLKVAPKATESDLSAYSPPPSPGGVPVVITSDVEYEALPSGTQFIGPDHKARRKP